MLLGHSNSVEVALSGQQIHSRFSTLLSSSSSLLEKNGSAEAPNIKFHSLEHANALSILSDFGIISSNVDSNSKFVPPDFPPRDYSNLGPIKRQIKYFPKAFISTDRFLTIEGDSVLQVSTQDKVLLRFGSKGFENGQFNNPRDLCYDSRKQRIIVCDSGNNRIQVFDLEGKFLFKFGVRGFGKGYFDGPNSVDVDRKGNIYVCDSKIQVFSGRGKWVRTIKEITDQQSDKLFPIKLAAILSDGSFLVSLLSRSGLSSPNPRPALVGAKGDSFQIFASHYLMFELVLDPHENIWVLSTGHLSSSSSYFYSVYTGEGHLRASGTWPAPGSGNFTCDPLGNLYYGRTGKVTVI